MIFKIGASCICLAGILLARETDNASLVLLLVSGTIFAMTAIVWATNGYASWDRLMVWERRHPVFRLVTGQIGTTPDGPVNPAYRVLYVMVALLLGLIQIGAGVVGVMALVS